jgi:hypothetical protein
MSLVQVFTKAQAKYIPSLPQLLWAGLRQGIRCGTCVHFRPGFHAPIENGHGKCRQIEGTVHSQAVCSLYQLNPTVFFTEDESRNDVTQRSVREPTESEANVKADREQTNHDLYHTDNQVVS